MNATDAVVYVVCAQKTPCVVCMACGDNGGMLVCAIANQKGGAGKTTTTCGLGAALAERGRRVLLIDADPQGGLSDGLGLKSTGAEFFSAVYSRENPTSLAIASKWGFDVMVNGPLFEGFTPAASTQDDRESFLRDSLQKVRSDEWEYILIDCPPRLDLISTNALTAADTVLIPMLLEAPSVSPFSMLLQQVAIVKKKWNPALSISGVVPCKVDFRDNQSREILEWLRTSRDDLYETVIHKNVRLSEAHNTKSPITVYAPESSGANDYRKLAVEFEARHTRALRIAAN